MGFLLRAALSGLAALLDRCYLNPIQQNALRMENGNLILVRSHVIQVILHCHCNSIERIIQACVPFLDTKLHKSL